MGTSWPGRASPYSQEDGQVSHLVGHIERQISAGKTPAPAHIGNPRSLLATQTWLDPVHRGGGDRVFPSLAHPVVAQTPDHEMHIVDGHHRAFDAGRANKPLKAHVFKVPF